MYRGTTIRRKRQSSKRRVFITSLVVLGLFLVTNGALFFVYQGRTYPRTQLMGTTLGSVSYGALDDRIQAKHLLPKQFTLQADKKQVQVSPAELGISVDTAPTIASAKDQHPWLPIFALIVPPILDAPIRIDGRTLATQAARQEPQLTAAPQNARLTLDEGRVTIRNDVPGTTIDIPALQQALQTGLAHGKTTIAVPMRTVAADVPASKLQTQKQELDKQLSTRVTLQYGSKAFAPTKAEMSQWYERDKEGFTLSTDTVARTVLATGKNFGVQVKDNYQTATDIVKALKSGTAYSKSLTAATPNKTITYCTALKNLPQSELPALKEKAALTLADSRGWSLNGQVAFKEVASGCDFTLWLSAAQQMPTFGPICDSMWSCRTGPNVVINNDRWQHASPAWNEYGGNLQQYRDMVINHETGHWLGFGHDHCPGAGQQAPVMQQQSINLQGCTFSPWPNSSELATFRHSIGL